MNSCFYQGQVRHRRFAPRPHSFTYKLFYVFIDLDELDNVFRGKWFWSTRRVSLAWFRRTDYLGDDNIPLKQAVYDRVQQVTGNRPRGPVRLLTHLRYFGYIFNPVSFYYCYDKTGTNVETIVAEITNTPWGERHSYVLDVSKDRLTGTHMRFEMDKDFHVSPFIPMDIHYDWRFNSPDKSLNVHMIDYHDGEKLFDATLRLKHKNITTKSCALMLATYPFMTAKVIAAIHWQALRLYLKRTPFFSHPKHQPANKSGGANSAETL